MKSHRSALLRKQTGNLLISTVIALGLIGIVQIGAAKHMINTARASNGTILGAQVKDLMGVMDTYITTYGRSLQPDPPLPITGVANPLSPTISELQGLGLTSTSGTINPILGGEFLTMVQRSPAGCTAPQCNLRGRVWLRDPILDIETGTPDLRVLGSAVAGGKGGMGFSLPDAPSIIRSSAGWTEDNPDPANRPGILMGATGYDGSGLAQFIKRDGTQPVTADFPMTGLDGVAYSITGAKNITAYETIRAKELVASEKVTTVDATATGTVTANSVVSTQRMRTDEYLHLNGKAVAGTACSPNGLASTNAAGLILSCQSGVWKSVRGSDVLTGYIWHGSQIPLPAGYSQAQCTWSAQPATVYHPATSPPPDRYGGSYGFADGNRIVTCGMYDNGWFLAGYGYCSYVISCRS